MHRIFLPLFLFLLSLSPSLALAQIDGMVDPGVVVKLDGESLDPAKEYTLNTDETFQLEIEGLKPSSEVDIKVKKGMPLKKETRQVPEDGHVKMLVDSPRIQVGAVCVVDYITADGQARQLKFKLKFRDP